MKSLARRYPLVPQLEVDASDLDRAAGLRVRSEAYQLKENHAPAKWGLDPDELLRKKTWKSTSPEGFAQQCLLLRAATVLDVPAQLAPEEPQDASALERLWLAGCLLPRCLLRQEGDLFLVLDATPHLLRCLKLSPVPGSTEEFCLQGRSAAFSDLIVTREQEVELWARYRLRLHFGDAPDTCLRVAPVGEPLAFRSFVLAHSLSSLSLDLLSRFGQLVGAPRPPRSTVETTAEGILRHLNADEATDSGGGGAGAGKTRHRCGRGRGK